MPQAAYPPPLPRLDTADLEVQGTRRATQFPVVRSEFQLSNLGAQLNGRRKVYGIERRDVYRKWVRRTRKHGRRQIHQLKALDGIQDRLAQVGHCGVVNCPDPAVSLD
jgi:hypothetical protein